MKARHLRPTPRAVRVGRALTVPVVALAALSAAAPAMAARPSGGSSSSGSSLSVVVETGPDQTPNFGETITFKVTSTVYKKWVDVTCYRTAPSSTARPRASSPSTPGLPTTR